MAYCTQAEIEAALGGADDLKWLTDPTNTATDTAAVTSAIEAAGAVIDSFAAGTPGTGTTAGALWAATPIQAKHAAIAIAVYKLYQRIRREDVPPGVAEDYRLYVGPEGSPDEGLLGLLARGKVSWFVEEPPARQQGAAPSFVSPYAEPRSTSLRRATRFHLDKL